jgi:hypothetical protein
MAVKALKLVATLLSTLVLAAIGTTSVTATEHTTLVSGFEMYATSSQGRFLGTATGQGENGVSGAWSIVVDHSSLDPCWRQSWTDPCAYVTGGSFSLAATNPGLITGTFDPPVKGVNAIVLGETGPNCTTQLFKITDSLSNVGTGTQRGHGSFVGYLWHHRHWVWGRCVTYSATVQGTVVLDF